MSFSTYWDLEPKARAALSESDVQRYLDAELMLKGVLKVEPLQLDKEPAEPHLPTRTFYKLQGFDAVFDDSEKATQFAALLPVSSNYRYMSGYSDSIKYVEPLDTNDLQVVPIQLADADAVTAAKAELERCSAVKSANAALRVEYEKAIKLQNEALQGLWQDWHERRREAARHEKVVDTYSSYVQTAGDHDIAAKFLLKVFSAEQIKEASEWTGVTIATAFPEEAPEPGPSHPDAPVPTNDDAGIPF